MVTVQIDETRYEAGETHELPSGRVILNQYMAADKREALQNAAYLMVPPSYRPARDKAALGSINTFLGAYLAPRDGYLGQDLPTGGCRLYFNWTNQANAERFAALVNQYGKPAGLVATVNTY